MNGIPGTTDPNLNQFQPFSPPSTRQDPSTDHQSNDLETPTIDTTFTTGDTPIQDLGYDADVEVVKPYAIEEPDDEPYTTSQGPTITKDRPEQWQGDLVDSMEDLHCDSDGSNLRFSQFHIRGKKRKSDIAAAETDQSFQHSSSGTTPDPQYERGSTLSPKRVRKTKRLSKTHPDFFRSGLSESGSSESFTSQSPSSDASGADTTGGTAVPEQMDLD